MKYLIQITFMFSTRGTAFISGHADGSIVRYIVTEESSTEQQVGTICISISIIYKSILFS